MTLTNNNHHEWWNKGHNNVEIVDAFFSMFDVQHFWWFTLPFFTHSLFLSVSPNDFVLESERNEATKMMETERKKKRIMVSSIVEMDRFWLSTNSKNSISCWLKIIADWDCARHLVKSFVADWLLRFFDSSVCRSAQFYLFICLFFYLSSVYSMPNIVNESREFSFWKMNKMLWNEKSVTKPTFEQFYQWILETIFTLWLKHTSLDFVSLNKFSVQHEFSIK